MKKQLATIGLIFATISLDAQLKYIESDTLKIQTIEQAS